MAKTIGEIAAIIHADMCDDNANGYSWEERRGQAGNVKTLTIDGKKYSYNRGDRDCSSSVCEAWQLAIQYTKYKGALDGATYTGNMRSVFHGSGLFDIWNTATTEAVRGDVYLNDSNHTAMCQDGGHDGVYGYDALSEFCWGDVGAYGNKRGDQSGHEAYVHAFYDYPWNVTLHYNGKADENSQQSDAKSTSKTSSAKPAMAKKMLYGIDVSSNQPKSIVADVPNDFAIVKMSGNPQGYDWDYVNPYAKRQAADAMKKHGLLALYHFTWGKQAATEAEFFVNEVKKLGYLGKAMLVIDYEAEAVGKGQTWVKKFADKVKALAGYAPVIYASGSVIVSQNLFSLGYPIWCANYYKGYEAINGYDTSGCKIYGGCEKSVLWQYTSQGYLKGYDGPLDCSVFFGTADDWKKLCGASSSTAATAKKQEAGAKKVATAKQATDKPGTYRILVNGLNVRSKPSLGGSVVASYDKGETVVIDSFKTADGWVWGSYVSYSGKRRYVAVRSTDGKNVYAKRV